MRRLESLVASAMPAAPAPALEIDGRVVPLAVRRSARARRLYLRVDPIDESVVLVLPRHVSLAEGLRFARDQRLWVARRLQAIPPQAPFADGALLPFLGETLTIRQVHGARLPSRRIDHELCVAGASQHVARRVRDWLKREARRELTGRSRAFAERLGRTVRRVRLGDPKSRWGSCSATGGLAYSWRLVLAPPWVMDYVVAHEVAHLVEPNHGMRFWRLVGEFVADIDAPRAWLRRHGPRLLRHG
ncbi:MAG: M48 family metallopeptidase [Pseudomonadota bacterium]